MLGAPERMVDFGSIRKKLERFYHPALGRPSYCFCPEYLTLI